MSTRKKWAVAVNQGEKVRKRSQKAAYDCVRDQAALDGTGHIAVYVDEGSGRWSLYEAIDGSELALWRPERMR